MDKVEELTEAKPFEVEEKTEKEMKLVDPSEFENIISEEVKKEDLEEIYGLTQEVVKIAHAKGAVGLSFPQIGVMKRAFVMFQESGEWQLIINPKFYGNSKKTWVTERSVSFEGLYASQKYKRISAAYYTIDIDKNDRLYLKKITQSMSGLKAYVFQSQTQVLDGKSCRILGTYIKEEDTNDEALTTRL